jgi:hypothetical protein
MIVVVGAVAQDAMASVTRTPRHVRCPMKRVASWRIPTTWTHLQTLHKYLTRKVALKAAMAAAGAVEVGVMNVLRAQTMPIEVRWRMVNRHNLVLPSPKSKDGLRHRKVPNPVKSARAIAMDVNVAHVVTGQIDQIWHRSKLLAAPMRPMSRHHQHEWPR